MERRNRAVNLFRRVVDVGAESKTARRRSCDAVLGVQSLINLLVIFSVKLDHAYPGAQLRIGASAQLCARNLTEAFFQGRGKFADARLDPVAPDQVMEVYSGSHRRHGGVIALSESLEFSRAARRSFDLGAPSHADHARPDFGDALLPDVKRARFLRPHEPFMRAGGIRIAPHLTQVERDRAEGLSAVHVSVDAALSAYPAQLFARDSHAGRVGDVG